LCSNGCRADIDKFGGDPNKVTIAGQSAGPTDTQANVISPLAKGLVNRAIFENDLIEPSPLANAETTCLCRGGAPVVPGHGRASPLVRAI
jgi:hypothetical protein